jgi:hypothetical protein
MYAAQNTIKDFQPKRYLACAKQQKPAYWGHSCSFRTLANEAENEI